jgi:hypothetical protein
MFVFARAFFVVPLAALLVSAALSHAAWAADPVEVFIDGRDPAFLVVQGVAADASDQAFSEMEGYATLDGVSMVAWNQFRENAESLLGAHIVKNEYPGASIVLGVVALVKKYPGRPFAITWNGGLAVAFQDYQHAVETYRAYLDNAQTYEQRRLETAQSDPLNPQNQLAALLDR